MEGDTVPGNESKKHPGRPRKHESDKARVNAWKKEQKLSGRRLDCHIGNQASWRIGKLAQAWDCSLSSAVERLILEADSRYSSILFPEERDESKVEAVPASDCDMTADEERIIWAKVAKRKSG